MLNLIKTFYLSMVFSQKMAYFADHMNDASLRYSQISLTPPCKRMPETNTPAYFLIPRVKEMFFDKDRICDSVNFFVHH